MNKAVQLYDLNGEPLKEGDVLYNDHENSLDPDDYTEVKLIIVDDDYWYLEAIQSISWSLSDGMIKNPKLEYYKKE